jgi:hypothetical protein
MQQYGWRYFKTAGRESILEKDRENNEQQE